MSHTLYKQLKDSDEEEIPVSKQVWHYANGAHSFSGATAIICTGEFVESFESHGEYISKTVERGGITCPRCMEIIKEYKAIKL